MPRTPGRIFVLAGIMLMFGALLFAEESGFRLDYKIGFEGFVVSQAWNELEITTGKGAPGAVVELSRTNEDGLVFSLDSWACERPVHIHTVHYSDGKTNALEIRIRQGDKILSSRSIPLRQKLHAGHLALTVGLSRPERESLANALMPDEPIRVMDVSAAEFPDLVLAMDPVSLVVIRSADGKLPAAMTPASQACLLAWLSAGGKVVQLGRPEAEAGIKTYGLGTYIAASAGISNWQSQASIQTWSDSRRHIFTSLASVQEKPSKKKRVTVLPLNMWVGVGLIAWAILSFVVVRWHKHWYALLVILSGVVMVASIPLGMMIDRLWQRGAEVQMKAIVLPSSAGLLLDGELSFPNAGNFPFWETGASPWGVHVGFPGGSKGMFFLAREGSTDTPVRFRHEPYASCFVRSYLDEKVKFQGFVPAGNFKLASSRGGTRAIRMFDQNTLVWKTRDGLGGEWIVQKEMPAWLLPHVTWIESLEALGPGAVWLFGRDSIEDISIKLQGVNGSFVWAWPQLGDFAGGTL